MGCNRDKYGCNGVNKCERKENVAKDLACKAQKLQACISEILEKAQCLQEKADCLRAEARRYQREADKIDREADELMKQAICLSEKLAELMKKSDCAFIKAVDCYRKECKDDKCDFHCGCDW